MGLIINGKQFLIKDKMKNIFKKAIKLSQEETCIQVYIKDDNDASFDAIGFINTDTGENEIVYIKYLREAIGDAFFDFKKLFLKSMVTTGFASSLTMMDLDSILKLNPKIDVTSNNFIIKDDILHIYIPLINPIKTPINKKVEFHEKLLQDSAKNDLLKSLNNTTLKSTPQRRTANVFNKKFTPAEKRNAINSYLKLNENVDLFFIPILKSILRVDKTTGESKIYTISTLLENPNLGLESADDFLTLGLFTTSINKPFKKVTVCDIRHAFKFFPNPENLVSELNYTVNDDTLYLVYASPEIVSKAISLKEYSILSYRSFHNIWDEVAEKYEPYGFRIFYIHRNSKPDCIMKCDETTKTSSVIELDVFRKEMEEFSFNYNSDISVVFPIDRIFDLNEYNTEDIKLIRIASMKVINVCDIKTIREEDEFSIGYDKKNNVCFYCAPKY